MELDRADEEARPSIRRETGITARAAAGRRAGPAARREIAAAVDVTHGAVVVATVVEVVAGVVAGTVSVVPVVDAEVESVSEVVVGASVGPAARIAAAATPAAKRPRRTQTTPSRLRIAAQYHRTEASSARLPATAPRSPNTCTSTKRRPFPRPVGFQFRAR